MKKVILPFFKGRFTLLGRTLVRNELSKILNKTLGRLFQVLDKIQSSWVQPRQF